MGGSRVACAAAVQCVGQHVAWLGGWVGAVRGGLEVSWLGAAQHGKLSCGDWVGGQGQAGVPGLKVACALDVQPELSISTLMDGWGQASKVLGPADPAEHWGLLDIVAG